LLRGETFSPTQRGSYAEGRKRDVTIQALPANAEWLFMMHDDSAPLALDWYEWLRERIGDGVCGGFLSTWASGLPHPSGALYRVAWLRDTGAIFTPHDGYDVGNGLATPPTPPFIAQTVGPVPWWLRQSDVAQDETGRLLYAHLGGGTIGATSRRLPWWAWPYLVHRHLDRR